MPEFFETRMGRVLYEIVADYEAKIAAVKQRAAAKKAKAAPDGAAFLAAARALSKALAAAESAENAPKRGVLEAAIATLAVHADEAGFRMPQPRATKPGGRRKKTAAA